MIYPTPRAVYWTVGAAPVALALGVLAPGGWAAALLWVVLVLALTLADGLLAPALRGSLAVDAPGSVGVGETVAVTPWFAPSDGRPRAVECAVDVSAPLVDAGAGRFHAARRGTAAIVGLWARTRGPLGLAYRQTRRDGDGRVLVLPDMRPVREQGMRQFLRSTEYGSRMRTDSGDGSEFQALVEFQPGMERRTIDWKSTARHRALLAREFRSERSNSVVFAVDAGRAMSEPLDGAPRVDRAVSAALLSAFVALKSGDAVRLFGFAEKPRCDSGTISGAAGFATLQRTAATIDYGVNESNYTLSLVTLDQKLPRRSLILLFTEFTDPTAAELLLAAAGRLLRRHRVLFVLFHDAELEALLATRPQSADDVVRANVASTLLRERRIVIERLKRLGIEVIEAAPDALPLALAERYLALRERW